VEFLLTPLLAAISHTLGDSKIKSKSIEESFVCYSAVASNPSTGKTRTTNLISEALLNCEKIFHTNDQQLSKISNDKKKNFLFIF